MHEHEGLRQETFDLVLSLSSGKYTKHPLTLVTQFVLSFPFQCVVSLHFFFDFAEEVVSPIEVEIQKPRNLSGSESEECRYGEGVGVYDTLLKSDTHLDNMVGLFIIKR